MLLGRGIDTPRDHCPFPKSGSSYLGDSLESYQSTFFRIAGGRNGLFVKFGFDGQLPVLLRLSMGIGFVQASYAWVLLVIMNQKLIYLDFCPVRGCSLNWTEGKRT